MRLDIVRSETWRGLGPADLSSPPTCMIVGDQALIGLALEAYLEEMGFAVYEPLSSSAEALEWLATHTPRVAILDYSLKDGPCTTLVHTLGARGIPFVVYSGHRRSVAPTDLQNVLWLNKPCDRAALFAALTHVAPALASGTRGQRLDTSPQDGQSDGASRLRLPAGEVSYPL